MYPVHDHTSWHIVLVTSTYHHYTVFLKQILMNHTLCPNAGSSHEVCDWWPQLLHGQSKESGTGTSVTVTWVCIALVSTLNNAVYVDTHYSQLCSTCWMCVVLNLMTVCLSILLSTCIKNVDFVHVHNGEKGEMEAESSTKLLWKW